MPQWRGKTLSNVIRFQFKKGPEVRFLSHLDLVRTMERTIRRANLPIVYSEGFTPRPSMSYSYALPVGVLSEAEYGDFTFSVDLEPRHFVGHFNQYLPPGFEVVQAERLPEGTRSLQAVIEAASWRVSLPAGSASPQAIKERWEELLDLDSFVTKRETKKGIREVDVRSFLFAVYEIAPSATGTVFDCLCGLGNEANLRMEELGELLGFAHLEAEITRTGQFIKDGNHYFPPLGNRGL